MSKPRITLAMVALAVVSVLVSRTSAGPNVLPFYDDFEAYPNGTPLVDGTNGWYASSNDITVQNVVSYSGDQAAKISSDGTLSNRFESFAYTNVWVQADMRIMFIDDAIADDDIPPRTIEVTDTNVASLFYINTSGYFVVHNGVPGPDTTHSTNWVALSQAANKVQEEDWVRVLLRLDYLNSTWSLSANHVELTNGIGFVGAGRVTNFLGFALFNAGDYTSYLDNVRVTIATPPPDLVTVPPRVLTNSVFLGNAPAAKSFDFINKGAGTYNYTMTITNAAWLTSSTNSGLLGEGDASTNTIPLAFDAVIATWGLGVSNGTVVLATTNNGGETKWLDVCVQVVDWGLSTCFLTNDVMAGNTPATNEQTFWITNRSTVPLNFTLTIPSNNAWLSCAPTNCSLAPGEAVSVALVYSNTANFQPGTSNTTIWISDDGVNAADPPQFLNVILNLMQMTNNVPADGLITHVIEGGFRPPDQTFNMLNLGQGTFAFKASNTASAAASWVGFPTNSGTVAALGSTSVTMSFSNTTGWALGAISNTTIKVVSTNGGGATNEFVVTVIVTNRPAGTNLNFYVSTNGAHLGPFTNWAMAATNIADVLAIAQDGNSVFLSNGTFVLTNRLTISSDIKLKGWNSNPASTILWGSGATNCLVVNSTGAFVSDITIQNGGGNSLAGGVYMPNGGTLSNCWIAANTSANTSGTGGVLASNNALVVGCVISGNVGGVIGGAKISQAKLKDSTVVGNNTTVNTGNGGGIYIDRQTNNLVTNCIIYNNAAAGNGGGVAMLAGEMTACSIVDNTAARSGGGVIIIALTNCLIGNSKISGNTAVAGVGGGVLITNAPSNYSRTLRNCLVSLNSPEGIIQSNAPTLSGLDVFESCTIVSNAGTGLRLVVSTTNLIVRNNVIYGNLTNINANLTGTTNALTYNCADYAKFPPDKNNITDAPLFVDWKSANYRLLTNSPGINAGLITDWMTAFARDMDGNPRITEELVDIGAYENPKTSWSVNPAWLTNSVLKGAVPTNRMFSVSNSAPTETIYFTMFITNDWITSLSGTNGSLSAGQATNIELTYNASIADWSAGSSNSTMLLVVTNSMYPTPTQTVAVTVNVMALRVTPTNLVMTNGVMYSNDLIVPSQTFSVWNESGAGTFTYSNAPLGEMTNWMSLVVTNYTAGSNTLTVVYRQSPALNPGDYEGLITLWASSEGGGYAEGYVHVKAQVVARPVLKLDPTNFSQAVDQGINPNPDPFNIWNGSAAPAAPMAYTLTALNGEHQLINDFTDPGGYLVNAGETNLITINYADISLYPAGVYTATVQVVARDAGTNYLPIGTVVSTSTIAVQVEVLRLDAPSGVTATDGTYTNKVVVNWNAMQDVLHYKVYRSLTFNSSLAVAIGQTIVTNFNDLTGDAGIKYYYWVSAVKSNWSEGVLSTNRETGYRGLAEPAGIFATDGAYTNKVRVTWPLVDGATGYQLYRGIEGGPLLPIYFTSGGIYDDMSVVGGVHYEYKVVATNGAFGSALSAGETGYAFGAPTGLTASKGTYVGSVQISWAALESATEYEVWRSTRAVLPPESGALKASTVTTPTFRDSGVVTGARYYYWVRGVGLEAGVGAWSGMDYGYSASADLDLWVTNLVVLPVQLGLGGSPVIASFRIGNDGSTNMTGANGTIGAEFFATTNQTLGGGIAIPMGSVCTTITLAVGAEMVVKVAGNNLVAPETEGDYNIFVHVFPASPSLLVDANTNNNVTRRDGVLRVRASGGLNYQVFNDYDGDGISELGVYRDRAWSVRALDGRVLADEQNIFNGVGRPVLGDIDGDRCADPMIYDTASGKWQILFSGNNYHWAGGDLSVSGYRVLVADYERVGHGNPSAFHEQNGRWYVKEADGGLMEWNWGASGYEPVIGDYDGDGCWDMAVYQESTGLWFIRTLNGQLLVPGVVWGGPGCCPVPGDYDGDGCWDAAYYVRSSGHWFIASLDGRWLSVEWGGWGAEPVMGDYDGDGKWDLAVYQESTGLWYIRTLDGKLLAWANQLGGVGYRPIGK